MADRALLVRYPRYIVCQSLLCCIQYRLCICVAQKTTYIDLNRWFQHTLSLITSLCVTCNISPKCRYFFLMNALGISHLCDIICRHLFAQLSLPREWLYLHSISIAVLYLAHSCYWTQSLCFLNGKSPYFQISWSPETRQRFQIVA